MPGLLELSVSHPVLRTLQRLRNGIAVTDLAALPPRTRRLIERLEEGGHAHRLSYTDGSTDVRLTDASSRHVPPSTPSAVHRVTRAHLDSLGLRNVPPFEIHKLPRPNGRPTTPGPRVFLTQPMPWDFENRRPLDETLLALLVVDPKACREVVMQHPGRDWGELRDLIHAEKLGGRARYHGINKLLKLRLPRQPRRPRRTRSDAVRRAKTEPVPGRRRR